MKLTWKGNVAKVGGVKFAIKSEVNDWWALFFHVLNHRQQWALLSYYDFKTEAEARAEAEGIAEAIFGGETVWRFVDPYDPYGNPSYSAFEHNDPTSQRGLFVPLEGE